MDLQHHCPCSEVLPDPCAFPNGSMVMLSLYHTAEAMSVHTHCMLHAGVLELLLQLHKWPHGLGKDLEWYARALRVISDVTAEHSRNACSRGISLERHVRSVLAVPG